MTEDIVSNVLFVLFVVSVAMVVWFLTQSLAVAVTSFIDDYKRMESRWRD